MAKRAMGILAGIARHAERRGPMEVLETVALSFERGVEGDCRGPRRENSRNRRQVTLLTAEAWAAATAELAVALPWQERRANLLVEGIDLRQPIGTRICIGDSAVLEITGECDPCSRMDALADGLQEALRPDWRGGATARVVTGGPIAAGDAIRIEAPAGHSADHSADHMEIQE